MLVFPARLDASLWQGSMSIWLSRPSPFVAWCIAPEISIYKLANPSTSVMILFTLFDCLSGTLLKVTYNPVVLELSQIPN